MRYTEGRTDGGSNKTCAVKKRQDLKLILTPATLNAVKFSYLGEAVSIMHVLVLYVHVHVLRKKEASKVKQGKATQQGADISMANYEGEGSTRCTDFGHKSIANSD